MLRCVDTVRVLVISRVLANSLVAERKPILLDVGRQVISLDIRDAVAEFFRFSKPMALCPFQLAFGGGRWSYWACLPSYPKYQRINGGVCIGICLDYYG